MSEKPKSEDRVIHDITSEMVRLIHAVDDYNLRQKDNVHPVKPKEATIILHDKSGNQEQILTFPVDEKGMITEKTKMDEVRAIKTRLSGRDTNGDGLVTKSENDGLPITKDDLNSAKDVIVKQLEAKGANKKGIDEVKAMIDKIGQDGFFSNAENALVTEKLKSLGIAVKEGDGQKPNAADPSQQQERVR